MMHIKIDLDTTLQVPLVDKTLTQLVTENFTKWPTQATCAVQESDGGICWWSSPVSDVKKGMESAAEDGDLTSILGIGNMVTVEYVEYNNQAICAKDWKSGLVTEEEFSSSIGYEE